MQDVRGIISMWPSMVELQRDIRVKYPTIASWKLRNSVQRKYWKGLIEAAQRRGFFEVNAELLMELHSKSETSKASNDRAQNIESINLVINPELRGHFSRYRDVQRARFASLVQVNEHVDALRDEWDR